MLAKNAIPTKSSMNVHLAKLRNNDIINMSKVNPTVIFNKLVHGGSLS